MHREPSEAADDALVARVRERVFAAIAQEQAARLHTVRAADDGWEIVSEGVQRKILQRDLSSQSCLMRLAPGARVAGHHHTQDEECVVLDGSLRIGSHLVLGTGDFHLAPAGTTHEETTSETGALVYLRGAPEPAAC
ncbi:MAG TPA: cupin domain-containing protein [Ramlibacter sp.]|jgi:quercetin dioxygenase-like cupin family protein|nr:cupin domain-containing protein [Ramlibacter sp.]